MSSDTSDDENLELVRAAVDNDFFKNGMFDPNKCNDLKGQVKMQTKKPSLRYQEEQKNHMGVTPEFQLYVGKQLMEFLDSRIKEVDVAQSKHESKNGIEGGIRLFGSSPNPLSCNESLELAASHPKKRKKQKPRRDDDKISKKEQYREAAVSPEWILSKDAVAGWEPSTKGKLEIYSAEEVAIESGAAAFYHEMEGKKKKQQQQQKRLTTVGETEEDEKMKLRKKRQEKRYRRRLAKKQRRSHNEESLKA